MMSKDDSVNQKIKNEKDDIVEHADELYQHVKEKASHLYEEGKHTVCEAQVHLKQHTDNLIKHVREKPLSSLLIAGGLGFIISSLLKK